MLAACENRDGEYGEFRVVLNRSLQIAQGLWSINSRQFEKIKQAKELAQLPKNPECMVEEPRKLITWLITEELAHVHFGLKAGSAEKEQQMQERYKQWLQKKSRIPSKRKEPIYFSFRRIGCITNSCTGFSFLCKSSERANWFSSINDESLKAKMNIILNSIKAGPKTYIYT